MRRDSARCKNGVQSLREKERERKLKNKNKKKHID